MFNKLREVVRPIVGSQLFIFITGFVLFCWLYLLRLGTLTKGLSPAEVQAANNSASIENIIHDPIYAPHKLLQYGLRELFGYHPWCLRAASVIIAAFLLMCFYNLCSRWFGRLIGTVTTIALASAPWVTLLGRSATPSIMLLVPALLLFSYYWFARSKKWVTFSWLFFCVCVGAALYVPGLVWLLVVGVVINRRSLIFSLKRLKLLQMLVGISLVLILIAPLIWAIIRAPSLLHHWLLIPTNWIGLGALAKNFGWAISSLFFRTRQHIEWIIGRAPILMIVSSALAFFGAYAMSLQARQKLYAIAALVLFGCLASAANNNYVYLSYCLVPLMMLSAAGLRFLFLQWQAVFPRNPLPRYFAYGLIIMLTIGQIAYGVRSTIYAWPHTSDTKSIFVIK
jgi:4-amino-4-deoxy-L-arabinose transferase-like glycosyltransferase